MATIAGDALRVFGERSPLLRLDGGDAFLAAIGAQCVFGVASVVNETKARLDLQNYTYATTADVVGAGGLTRARYGCL